MNARERAERAPNAHRKTYWANAQRMGDPSLRVLLMTLALYADQAGRCWPALKTLADECEVSVSTVQRMLRKLETFGVVRKEARADSTGARTSSLYVLQMDVWVDVHGGLPALDPPSQIDQGGGQFATPPGHLGDQGALVTLADQVTVQYEQLQPGVDTDLYVGAVENPPILTLAPTAPADAGPWCSLHNGPTEQPCRACGVAGANYRRREAERKRLAEKAANDALHQEMNEAAYRRVPTEDVADVLAQARAKVRAANMARPAKAAPETDVPRLNEDHYKAGQVAWEQAVAAAREQAEALAGAVPT